MISWAECAGFDWDDGNLNKNREKHGVADAECEEVFFNRPLVVRHDRTHSSEEERRWHAPGLTDGERYLLVVFTVRRNLIRVISARPMTSREWRFYVIYEENEGKEA